MKTILTFALVSLAAGVFAVAGSILGGSLLGQTGLFAGALLVGSAGVIVAGLLAHKTGLIEPSRLGGALIGGIVGFLIAAALAVWGSQTFNNPVVPVLSVSLVGVGFLLGAKAAKHRKSGIMS